MPLSTYGLSASVLQACATDLAKVVQKYNPRLSGELKLELHSKSEKGQHEISVHALTHDGQEHSLVRVILKGNQPTERDLNLRLKILGTVETH
jgi:hypothetical protein